MLDWFFHPKHVAVIGASRDEKSVGGVLLRNMLKSKVHVFPINPHAKMIQGKRTYASIKDAPKVDIAIIAVPAKIVPSVLMECAEKKVKGVVIISAGFGEVGENILEAKVKEIAQKEGIRVLGPNCLGFATSTINATFFKGNIQSGDITIISQSGAIGDAILDMLDGQKQGVQLFVSVGNAIDISSAELVEHASRDAKTKSIGVYIESFRNGRGFLESCKKAKQPVIVVKAGLSSAGKRAARSHTGAIATDDRIVSGAFEQSGIRRVNTLRELLETTQSAALQGKPKGKRVIVITNAGGFGVLSADEIGKHGLSLAKIDTNAFNAVLPAAWSHQNPIDILGDADATRYARVFVKALKQKSRFDAAVVILTPLAMTQSLETAKHVVSFAQKLKKPCYACFVGGSRVEPALHLLRKQGVPTFYEPQDAISALALLS